MMNDDTFRQWGVPLYQLGKKWKTWKRRDLRVILDHYDERYRPRACKLELMHALRKLRRDRGLDRKDSLTILRNHRRGMALPPLKPVLQTTGTDHWGSRSSRTPEPFVEPDLKTEDPVPPTQRECLVCLETLPSDGFPERMVTPACSHGRDVCLPCISQSIATQCTSKIWNHIDCPSCGERLEYDDIREFADSAVFGG